MEPHVCGDDNTQESSQVAGVLASKTILKTPTGSPSGDFGNPGIHQFVTVVTDLTETGSNSRNSDIYQQPCDLGDAWLNKYPIPLSKYPQRPIRTGNLFYDGIIHDLEHLGYKPLQVIAKGRSGTIILAQNLHTSDRACDSEIVPIALKLNSGKVRRNRSPSNTDMTEEMTIHRNLHHPNIVSWIDNISYKGRVGTVLEFCENGTLEQLVKVQDAKFLTESVARRYYRQILSAVSYVHALGYAHRDICLQNILINHNNVPKLSDFGHAVCFTLSSPLCTDECGSMGFQSPEMLEKKPYDPKLSDIWSLGVMLYTMCIGRLPLGCIRDDIVEDASREIHFPEERVLPLSKEFKYLIKGHLAYVPEARFSMNRLRQSEWVTTVDTKVMIGNFYRIRQPQKTDSGSLETAIKMKLEI